MKHMRSAHHVAFATYKDLRLHLNFVLPNGVLGTFETASRIHYNACVCQFAIDLDNVVVGGGVDATWAYLG